MIRPFVRLVGAGIILSSERLLLYSLIYIGKNTDQMMRMQIVHFIGIMLMTLLMSVAPLSGAEVPGSLPDIAAELTFDKNVYQPGDTAVVAIVVRIPAQFHLYSNPLGPGIGKPLMVNVTGDSLIQWLGCLSLPALKFQPLEGEWVWAWTDSTVIFLKARLAQRSNRILDASFKLDGLMCHTSCLPVHKELEFSFVIDAQARGESFSFRRDLKEMYAQATNLSFSQRASNEATPNTLSTLAALPIDLALRTWEYEPQENKIAFTLWVALIFAFFAGIILNAMPCVLPVLGIKILSFTQGIGHSRRTTFLRALSFSLGILVVFLMLATLAAFAGYSWGEQFQNPLVLAGLIAAMVVFSLGMFDVYTMLLPPGAGQVRSGVRDGFWSDFTKGMFATILATPCSGPFLGATLAWALTQPTYIIYLVFAAVGGGMAFPYLILSLSTSLARRIPKPGPWMNTVKMVMGFVLLGFAAYLLKSVPAEMAGPTVIFCVALALAIVVFTRLAPFGSSAKKIIIAGVVAGVIIGAALYMNFRTFIFAASHTTSAQETDDSKLWAAFSTETLNEAHSRGQHVIIDFTASWCMNCQYNKVAILESKEIVGSIREKNILTLTADLTGDNPVAQSLLHHLGSRSIPFLAIFPGNDPYRPIIMRDILDKEKLRATLNSLADKTVN